MLDDSIFIESDIDRDGNVGEKEKAFRPLRMTK